MLSVYVIAFIVCSDDGCRISYPRPREVYGAYEQCRINLPKDSSHFDASKMTGAEIACIEVPQSVAVQETIWRAIETSNIRKGPSVGGDVVGEVKKGESFLVVGISGNWLEIRLRDGLAGYVWAARALPGDAAGYAGSTAPRNR